MKWPWIKRSTHKRIVGEHIQAARMLLRRAEGAESALATYKIKESRNASS